MMQRTQETRSPRMASFRVVSCLSSGVHASSGGLATSSGFLLAVSRNATHGGRGLRRRDHPFITVHLRQLSTYLPNTQLLMFSALSPVLLLYDVWKQQGSIPIIYGDGSFKSSEEPMLYLILLTFRFTKVISKVYTTLQRSASLLHIFYNNSM